MDANKGKMMKKANNSNSNRIDYRIHTFDQLSWMSDDELTALNSTLERDRESISARGRNPKNVEIELCYVQREWDIRNTRRAAHSAWLTSTGAEMTNAKATN